MKNPFLSHVFKKKIGASINFMPEDPNTLNEIIQLARAKNCKLHFPKDYRFSETIELKNPNAVRILT